MFPDLRIWPLRLLVMGVSSAPSMACARQETEPTQEAITDALVIKRLSFPLPRPMNLSRA